jgi:hypothetical protein
MYRFQLQPTRRLLWSELGDRAQGLAGAKGVCGKKRAADDGRGGVMETITGVTGSAGGPRGR